MTTDNGYFSSGEGDSSSSGYESTGYEGFNDGSDNSGFDSGNQDQSQAQEAQGFSVTKEQWEQAQAQIQNAQKMQQDWQRMAQVFNPQQSDPQANQDQILAQMLQNPHQFQQSIAQQASQAAFQQMQYEMAAQQVMSEYQGVNLSQFRPMIESEANIQKGYQKFIAENGRPPQTPLEQTKAAVSAFMADLSALTGYQGNQDNNRQADNAIRQGAIPLQTRGQGNGQGPDINRMSERELDAMIQSRWS